MNYKAKLLRRINHPLYNELLKDKNEGKVISIYELTDNQINTLMFEEDVNSKELKELFDFNRYPDDIVEKAWHYHFHVIDGNGSYEDIINTLCVTFIKNYRNEKKSENNNSLLIDIIQKEMDRRLKKIEEMGKEELYEREEVLRRKISYEKFSNNLLEKLKQEKIEDGENFIANEYELAVLSGEYSDEKWKEFLEEIEEQSNKLRGIKSHYRNSTIPISSLLQHNENEEIRLQREEIQTIFKNAFDKLNNCELNDLDEIKKQIKTNIYKIAEINIENIFS